MADWVKQGNVLSVGPAAHFPNPYGMDITEIEGFDNLHHAKGIIRDSMEFYERN